MSLNPVISTPPKCRMIFHVGITGHRDLSRGNPEKLSSAISDVLGDVRSTVEGISRKDRNASENLFAPAPAHLRLFSSLAAGADCLAAERALDLGYELQAPFPFSRAEYAKDFTIEETERWQTLTQRAAVVFELDGDRQRSEEAYLAAGRVVLDQCDLLMAIWDGEEPRGIGGTGQIVEEAQVRGIPVIVIDAIAPHRITYLGRRLSCGAPDDTDDWRSQVRNELANILYPFKNSADKKSFPWLFFHERLPMASTPTSIATALKWTDALAIRYAKRFRYSVLARYLLAIPVMVGIFIGFYFSKSIQPWGFGLQFAAAVAILFLSVSVRQCKWHQRLVEYRFLAEHLRHCATLSELGYVLPVAQYPAHHADAESSWVNWYYRSLDRLTGLPFVRLDTEKLGSIAGTAIANIEDQIRFYRKKSDRCADRARKLGRLGMGLFFSGMVIIAIRMAGFFALNIFYAGPSFSVFGLSPDELSKLLNEIALVLPSLAPIVLGIRSQAEYPQMARRYTAMAEKLGLALDDLKHTPVMSRRILLPKLEAVSKLMLAEVSDWRVLIQTKTLSPA